MEKLRHKLYFNKRSKNLLKMLLVEFKLSWTFLIELIAKLAEFFGQNWCSTIEYT